MSDDLQRDVGIYDRDRWLCTKCGTISDKLHMVGPNYCGGSCRIPVSDGWRYPYFVRDGRFPPNPRRLFKERHPLLGAIRDWWDRPNSDHPVNGA